MIKKIKTAIKKHFLKVTQKEFIADVDLNIFTVKSFSQMQSRPCFVLADDTKHAFIESDSQLATKIIEKGFKFSKGDLSLYIKCQKERFNLWFQEIKIIDVKTRNCLR